MNTPDPEPPVPPVQVEAPQPAKRRGPPVEHQFKKGQSGNPGGRPKGSGITSELRRLLQQEHGGKLIAQLVAERLLKDALSGKHAQLQMLLDRTEGRLTEKHQVSSDAKVVRILVCDGKGSETPVGSLRELYQKYPQRLPEDRP